MPRQCKQFYPEAARRLFFAVINQAVQDVLENGREAEDAESWLLSRDFDLFCAPFGCNPEVVRQRLADQLAAMPMHAPAPPLGACPFVQLAVAA